MHFLLLALILVTSVGAFGALTFILLARGIYKAPQRSNGTKSVMILMGSGGHTGEMARMLRDINLSPFDHRVWVYTDDFSAKKARNLDSELQNSQKARSNSPRFASLPRARRVGQSWITTVFSSFYCLIACFYMIVKEKPSLIITNGPGSSVMLCYSALFLRVLRLADTHVLYIESLARVSTLSLSGRLLYPVADRFVVQWKPLASKYPRAVYKGILI